MAWTTESVAKLSTDDIKVLRENAARRSAESVTALCDAELANRAPKRSKRSANNRTAASQNRGAVRGFHFVCQKEQGVTNNNDGTVWSGTWVVNQDHAERGVKIGSYVALHEAKSQLSYLQGLVVGWRSARREREYAEGRPARIETGIDFHLRLTAQPVEWRGDGSGEKGYLWEVE